MVVENLFSNLLFFKKLMGVNSTKCAVGETPVTQNNKIDQSAEVKVFCWGCRTSVRTTMCHESQNRELPVFTGRVLPYHSTEIESSLYRF